MAFAVKALDVTEAVPRRRYPRTCAATGAAPPQYPEDDEQAEDAEVFSINPRTGERIMLKAKPR